MYLYKKFEQLFLDYRDNYARIFNVLYPSKNSTGFTERNLSVNFAKAYEAKNAAAVTWYEWQFGEGNNLHYDAIIIDPVKKEILLIESKRFSVPKRKIRSVGADIRRISSFAADDRAEFSTRIPELASYTVYGVILADVWCSQSGPKNKKAIWESFKNNSFLNDPRLELTAEDKKLLGDCAYFVGDFPDVSTSDTTIKDKYHLLALVWQLRVKTS